MSEGHAVVVGGTSGLGLEVVDRFLSRGFDVTVLSRRPSAHHEGNSRVHHVGIDLETLRRVDQLDLEAVRRQGPISYAVLTQRYRGTGDPWEGEIQVGLTASKVLIEAFSPHFSESGDRAIAVVSSVYAEFVGSSQPVGYHVAKAGMNAMVRYYAWALGPRGIRTNSIMPLSYVKKESRAFYDADVARKAVYADFVPLGRMGEASENANAVDFLCSDKASFINGQCLFVDGGVSSVWGEEIARKISGV